MAQQGADGWSGVERGELEEDKAWGSVRSDDGGCESWRQSATQRRAEHPWVEGPGMLTLMP